MPELHSFDTSALSELAEPQYASTRHRLIAAVEAGRVLVLVTHTLLWELPAARAANAPHFRAMMDLLFRISRRRVLLRMDRRIAKEIQNGGPLPFPDFVDPDHWLDPKGTADEIDSAAAMNLGRVRAFAFREAESAAHTLEGLEEVFRAQAKARGFHYDRDGWRRAMAKEFRKRAYFEDLAQHYAGGRRDRGAALVAIDASSIDPRVLPTAWAHGLIHTARVRAVIIGGTRPGSINSKAPGQMDLLHFEEAAAYADAFVAEDGRLRTFAKGVPGLRCDVLSFSEWARRIEGM